MNKRELIFGHLFHLLRQTAVSPYLLKRQLSDRVFITIILKINIAWKKFNRLLEKHIF